MAHALNRLHDEVECFDFFVDESVPWETSGNNGGSNSPNLGPNLGPIRFRFLRLVKLLPNVHTKSFGTHTRGSYTDE